MEDKDYLPQPFERWIWHDSNPFTSWKSACREAKSWALKKQAPIKIVTLKSNSQRPAQYRLMWLKKWPSEAVFLAEMVQKNREQAAKIAQKKAASRRKFRNRKKFRDDNFYEDDYLAAWNEAENELDALVDHDTEKADLLAEWQHSMDEFARNDEEGWPYSDDEY